MPPCFSCVCSQHSGGWGGGEHGGRGGEMSSSAAPVHHVARSPVESIWGGVCLGPGLPHHPPEPSFKSNSSRLFSRGNGACD